VRLAIELRCSGRQALAFHGGVGLVGGDGARRMMEKWLVQTRMGGCRESVDDSNPSCAVQPRHGRGTVVEEAEAAAAGWWFGSGS